MSVSIDSEAPFEVEDPNVGLLDKWLFGRCPDLRRDKQKFLVLKDEQKMFVYLVTKNSKESTHVEFKSSMSSEDIDFRMLRSACSMYNGLQPDMREHSLTNSSRLSSYVLYGVEEEERKSTTLRKTFCPLTRYKGEEEIQDLFNSSTMPTIEVYFHLVRFDSDMHFEVVGRIPAGLYAMLEVPKGACGPVYFKNKTKRKSGISRTSMLLLYSRSDAKNIPEKEWAQTLRENVHEQFSERFDTKGLNLVRDKLEEGNKSFRVLVLTQFSGISSPSDKESLSRALGRGKWDIIVDFDRTSREPSGHCVFIEEEINRQGRLYSVKAISELTDRIDPGDLEECQRGERTIYIQANGCSVRSKQEPNNAANAKKLIRSHALEPVFERNVTPKPVLCLSLVLTATVEEFSSSTVRPDVIPSLLKDAYESESGSENEFQLVTIYINDSVRSSIQRSDSSDSFVVPANQLIFMFNSLCPSESPKSEYDMPGVSGAFSMSRESFACYKPYLRLYHIRSGQRGYMSMGKKEREERGIELIRAFLAGSELSKEMLYINEQMDYSAMDKRVYVKRREIEKLKNKVKAALDYCRDRTIDDSLSDKQIVRFLHDPLSGATTIARIVLWQLRTDYPCIEVKCMGKLREIINAVCLIHKDASLPILIMFDSHISDYASVQSFISELKMLHPNPRFVVLFVERVSPGCQRAPVLTMELSDEEITAFNAIYDSVGGDITPEKFATAVGDETEKTPFLFGVWYFKKEYLKIREFVYLLLTDIDDAKKKLLFFASLSQLFIHAPLDLAIAAHCVGLSPAQGDHIRTLKTLGKQRHLLTVQKHNGIFGFAPVFVVGNTILECLFSHINDDKRVAQQIESFVDSLCNMADSPQLRPCLQKFVQDLITCGIRFLDPKRMFTDFVITMNEHLPLIQVEGVFLKLAQSFPEKQAHIHIHCARFFAYEPHDYCKSIEFVRKSLDLADPSAVFLDTECKDEVVLGLSAHLINCRLNSGSALPFGELQRLTYESIGLCHKAMDRRCPRLMSLGAFRAHPYCNEIQAQRVLLNNFFCFVCDIKSVPDAVTVKQSQLYFKNLEEPQYDAVKSAHETILQNIFKLEDMYEDGKVQQDTYTQKQFSKIRETKMEFVKRCYPNGENTQGNPISFPFAWVAVDYYIRESKASHYSAANNADFEADDFSFDQNVSFYGRWDRGWEMRHLTRQRKIDLFKILQGSPSKLARNYFELCIIIILLKPENALDVALKISTEWCRKCETDFLAHFMLGAFHLVRALTQSVESRVQALRLAMKSLETCHKASNLPSPMGVDRRRPGSQRPRILICRNGHRLVDMLGFFSRKQQAEKNCPIWRQGARKFQGSLEEHNRLVCNELNWSLHVPAKSVPEELMKKKTIVTFALALSFNGLVPVEIERRST